MNHRRLAAVIFTLTATVVLIAAFSGISSRNQLSSVTSMSDDSTGLSIFYTLAERTAPHGVLRSKTAILSEEVLSGVSMMVIASPLVEVSKHEAALIKAFVNDGGILVLSFHDATSQAALRTLLHEFDISSAVVDDSEFENGTFRRIRVQGDFSIAPPGTLLGLYSAQHFSVPSCKTDRFTCYGKETRVGRGRVVLFNGLIPIANGLIGKEHNGELALNIIRSATGEILIDEYRHLFTDKSLGDLLTDLRVVAPLAALFLGALGFFLLGDRDEELHERLFEDKTRVPVYHDFAKRVFLGSIEGRNGAARASEFNARCIEELFPERRDFMGGLPPIKSDPDGRLRAVVRRHRTLLVERGVIAEQPAATKN